MAAIVLNSMLNSGYHRTAYNVACQHIFYSVIWQIILSHLIHILFLYKPLNLITNLELTADISELSVL